MTRQNGVVYWATTVDDLSVCAPLAGTTMADLCVVGGGFAGLWTAIEFKQRFSDANVVVLESATCGSGASGRNGGWATSYWRRFDDLQRRYGVEHALWIACAANRALTAIGDFISEHEIDCGWRQQGGLLASTHPDSQPWLAAVEAVRSVGYGDMLEVIDAGDAQTLVGSESLCGGAIHTDTASVNPAKLIRGMRRVALELGVRIYEASPMTTMHREQPVVVRTTSGKVLADQVVLALGAWSAKVPELRRAYVTVGSNIVTTEPLGDQIAATPWSNGLVFGDDQISAHYSQVTPDGRIVFGRALGPLGFANQVTHRHEHHPATSRAVEHDFRRLFPQFASTAITHSWGGAVDRAPHGMPTLGTLGRYDNIHYIVGFSGQGVAQSRLLGRIAAAVVGRSHDQYARNALVGTPPQHFPPEPLRYAGGVLVKSLVAACERRTANGLSSPIPKHVLKALVGAHVPHALEPRRSRRRTHHN